MLADVLPTFRQTMSVDILVDSVFCSNKRERLMLLKKQLSLIKCVVV